VLIAINVPKWFIWAVDKICCAFLWKGRENANGGNCLVAWDKVQQPLDLGGLVILNLEIMSWSLQIRWLWLKKTDSNRPWTGLDLYKHPNAVILIRNAVESQGNGNCTLFWSEWLLAVLDRLQKCRTVAMTLQDQRWPGDIQGGLSLIGLFENFQLWDVLYVMVLSQKVDQHIWRLYVLEIFSSKLT